ncbi:MAG: glycerate kinase [Pseudomonadota bacterium]
MDEIGFLKSLFDCAVAAADPMLCVPKALPPKPDGRVFVTGAGKASARMAEAVETVWGPCEGLVITRYGYARSCQGIEIVEAAHPVPDAAGADATDRVLSHLEGLGADDTVIALISGGASALLVKPAGDMTLAEKQELNEALLRSGAAIDEMNVVRKHLSGVKGGQLAAAAWPAKMHALIISDVAGDDPAFIGSGPTVGVASTPSDALAILTRYGIELSAAAAAVLAHPTGVLDPNAPHLAGVDNQVVAAPSLSLDAAQAMAEEYGTVVTTLGDQITGEARDVAASHANMAKTMRAVAQSSGKAQVILSGGECTVTRRGDGLGGPNAEYALAAALALDGAPGIYAIAGDTDGVDGAAEVAGAIIGPDTLVRASEIGISPSASLEQNDSHGFFAAIDAQVVTGPTLTNVNDFRAFLVTP